jgi:iron complex transport system substrate-binding protein
VIIAVLGRDPVAEWVLPPGEVRVIDPAVETDPAIVDWSGIGLLVAPEFFAAVYPAIIESAESASVPVFRTASITSLALWRETALRLGVAAGRDERVFDLMLHLDRRLASIRARVGHQDPARVLVLTPEGYTFGVEAWITELIGAAGGINVAAEAGFADYRQVSDSAIHDLAPDVILLSPAWDRAVFLQIATYADLPAVQTGRVIRLPFSPTVAAYPGTEVLVLAWILHPRAMIRGGMP